MTIAAMMKPKKSRNNNPRWGKAFTFSKEIPTTPTFNLFHSFPDLLPKRPFDLRRSCITNELLEDIVAKSSLYAKQDKNYQVFEFFKG